MDYADSQRSWGKHAPSIIFVIILHVLVGYALVTGLARKMVDVIKQPLETKIIEEVKKVIPDTPPPPPPKLNTPPPPFIPPPEVNIQDPVVTPPPSITTTTTETIPETTTSRVVTVPHVITIPRKPPAQQPKPRPPAAIEAP